MDSPIQFDSPSSLLIALVAIPLVWWGWRNLTAMSPWRRALVCALRALVVLAIAFTLAQPKWLERGENLTVVLLVDRSQSISHQAEQAALDYLRKATDRPEDRQRLDRVGVINIGAQARVAQAVDVATVLDPGTTIEQRSATNLEHGVRLGLAIAPPDTATRFVLVSDGNETFGNVLAATEIARANGIPIDVLKIVYDYDREVLFERLVAPSMAREGEPITLRFMLRANKPATGRISLYHNDEILDASPDDDSTNSIPVSLDEGLNVRSVTLPVDFRGPQRFRAVFEADDPIDDSIVSNNRADAVVIVGGEGRVLVVHSQPEETASLRAAMADAEIEIDTAQPHELTSDLLFLSGYDGIILANVPLHSFGAGVDAALRRYVHDVGGGLIMLGGPDSMGAGGWIDSEVAKALPVRLDPPEKKQMPKGALVCIMHSCEIPQGNYWGQQCAIAAVESLSRLDEAGIIDFNWNVGGPAGGANWVFPLQPVGDKGAAIAAIRNMNMGDMPDFTPSMQAALTALQKSRSGQKHVIIISDGDPQPPSQALLNQFVASKISISTILTAGHGTPSDVQNMAMVARQTGGTAYNPTSPNQLPRIFIKEAMIVRRSLIVEGEVYQAIHEPSGRPGPFSGTWTSLPPVLGYVLSSPRPGYAPEIVSNFGDRDPIMAHWQYGLGKSVVFTSDATSRWGQGWVDWGQFQGFWERIVRWSMRPVTPTNIQQTTRLDGNRATLEVNVLGEDNQFANFGRISGLVLSPGLDEQVINLQQVGPGKWRGEYKVDSEGSWVANLIYETNDGERHSIQTGVSVPYSPEFKTLKNNDPLMTSVADGTFGRILPSDPTKADLFNREGLEVPRSLSDLWPLFAILASILFLLDVAARRLALDAHAMRRRWAELMSARQADSGERLDRLKTVRGGTQDRFAAKSEAAARRRSAAEASERFDAQADGQGVSMDVGREISASDDTAGQLKKSKPRPTPAQSDEDKADAQGGSYTSRLLAAKRRAREEKPDGEGDDGA